MFQLFIGSRVFLPGTIPGPSAYLTTGKKNEFCIRWQNLFLKRKGVLIEGSSLASPVRG